LDIVKKNFCSSQKTLRPLGVSSSLRAYPSVSGPSVAVEPRNNAPAGSPLMAPEPVIQTLSYELNLTETLASCVFFSNIHTLLHLLATLQVTTATNERSFSTLKRLLAYLCSTVGHNQAHNFLEKLKMCWAYFKTIEHRPATRWKGSKVSPANLFASPGKICWT